MLDAVLADEAVQPLQPRPVKGMRLAVPTTVALDDLDDEVAATFERALAALSRQGASIERIEVPEFHDVAIMNAKGGFAAAESYAWHRYLIVSHGDVYDPRVHVRILRGEGISAADYIDILNARRSFIARTEQRIAPYDALVLPTTANAPPRIADLADDRAFATQNLRALRNCTLINMLDGCAISLPAHREGEVPVGLMLAARADRTAASSNSLPEWRTSSVFDLTFNVEDKGALTPLTLAIDQAVIAGWTGRDPVARDKHIAELEAIGIARPATTPIYYRCSARRMTQADRIEVSGENSSGEVEFVLIGWQGRIFVGCGSDHTDRKVEAYSVTVSKQMCDKPVASVLWELEDVIGHWDRMILRSWAVIDGARVLYQEGTLDAMLPVKDLIDRGFGGKRLPDGCAMFGGTFAAKGGIRPADRFEFELEDPVLKRKISHGYDVITMPVLG